MATRFDDVMQLCMDLSAHQQIKVAVKNSATGAMVTGGSAFVGGLLGGPPGGALGGLLGYWLTSGKYRPLPQILRELPREQQQKLYSDIMVVLGNLDWMDATQLVALVMGNATLQQQVTAALLSYVVKELRAEVLSA